MFGKQRIDRRNLLQDSRQKNNRRYFWLLLLGLIIALTLGAVSIANAAPNKPAETGHLQLSNNKGQIFDALHLATDVSMSIQGMVATVTYRQSFRNKSSDWLEALYLFPLPATAAVNAMEMKIGERLIKGEIKEKQQARDIYQQAKKSGRRASLVEQQRPNIFTQKVANIGPGETIEVSLRYIQRVDYQFGQFSLRLPLTITPRYIPGAPLVNNSEIQLGQSGWGWSQATEQVPDADVITPFMRQFLANGDNNSVSIAITLNAGLPLATLESPLHDIKISRNGAYHNVEFS
jgi:Ca-activated chloride channel family protein